jgi:exosortase
MVENPVREGLASSEAEALGQPIATARTDPTAKQILLLLGGLTVLFCLSYTHLFLYFWQRWTEDHGPFGFGYFVPPSVAYLLWANRQSIKEAPLLPAKGSAWVAVGLLALLQVVGAVANVTFVQSITFMGLLLAIPYCIWGPAKFKVLWAPLLFTATMIPWPGQISNVLLFKMQHLSVLMAAQLFSWLHLQPVIDGTSIILPQYMFDVAPACAGLTILFPTVACAILTVMMLKANLWRKLLYVGLSVPVSILTNGARISLVGIIGNMGGTDLASRLHDASGFLGVIVSVIVLSIIGTMIGCATYKDEYMPKWAREIIEEGKELIEEGKEAIEEVEKKI